MVEGGAEDGVLAYTHETRANSNTGLGEGRGEVVRMESRRFVCRVLAMALMVSLTVSVSVAYAADNQSKAVELFESADARFASGDYAGARALYAMANKLYPDPSILYMVGRCHEVEREFAKAQSIFRRVLAMSELPDNVKRKTTEGLGFLDRLNPENHRLEVTTSTAAKLFLDGEDQGEGAKFSAKVKPGEHAVRVSADGYVEAEHIIAVSGDTHVFVDLEPASRRDPAGWVAVGAGGAALVAGVLLYRDALEHADNASHANFEGRDPAAYEDAKARAQMSEMFSLSASALGVGALGVGIYLLLSESTEAQPASSNISVLPNGVVLRW